MCCLFGLLDYKHSLTQKQQRRIVSMLAVAAEDRGTDATGIAYNSHDRLHIYKRPLPAHGMKLSLPHGIITVMGRTRMTTQGDEKRNYNNHPFPGLDSTFALAHNGVLYNDERLRKSEKLPDTRIETDSYIAVQLIEQSGLLSFDSLRPMAEKLEGSFTMTVLDKNDNLYFIRGDNPMCIYHYPDAGVYVYASTEPILLEAISKFSFRLGKKEKVDLKCGDILMIDKHGRQTRTEFDTINLMLCSYRYSFWHSVPPTPKVSLDREYIDDLKAVAGGLGYSPNYIDYLISGGYTGEEIEELMYYGGMF